MKKIFTASLLSITFASTCSATTFNQTLVEIDRLGSQTGQVFFMNFKEGFKTNCLEAQIYCPSNNDSCKNFFTIALSAKISGKKLLSVDYIQDDTTKYCILSTIQIN